jgi:hypothetical protein
VVRLRGVGVRNVIRQMVCLRSTIPILLIGKKVCSKIIYILGGYLWTGQREFHIAVWLAAYAVKMPPALVVEVKAAKIKTGANHLTVVKKKGLTDAGSAPISRVKIRC